MPIPLALTLGAGAVSSIIGGISAGKQRKKMRKYLNQQDAENQSWYNAKQ